MQEKRNKRKNKNYQYDYIKNMYIRYVTCLDCDYRYRFFDAQDYKSQKCFNEQCRSRNTKFNDVKPNYHRDEIRCYGRFKCSSCSHQWTSFATWIFYKQSCFKCSKQNHPYECRDAEVFDNKFGYGGWESEQKHEEINCEFCQEKGQRCTKFRSNDQGYFP